MHDTLVPDPEVAGEFSVTLMTLWRWDQSPAKVDLGWPPRVKIGRRNYRSRSQLEAFKKKSNRDGAPRARFRNCRSDRRVMTNMERAPAAATAQGPRVSVQQDSSNSPEHKATNGNAQARRLEGFALELKRPGGRLSEAQLEFLARFNDAGGHSAVAEGLDRALACLEAWGLLSGRSQ
jgi:hypothetical protein